jgi:hypothetical protein
VCGETIEDFRLSVAGALRNVQEAQRAWKEASGVISPMWADVMKILRKLADDEPLTASSL